MFKNKEVKEEVKSESKQFVKMFHPEKKLYADVHPLEQLNYFRGGWRKVEK